MKKIHLLNEKKQNLFRPARWTTRIPGFYGPNIVGWGESGKTMWMKLYCLQCKQFRLVESMLLVWLDKVISFFRALTSDGSAPLEKNSPFAYATAVPHPHTERLASRYHDLLWKAVVCFSYVSFCRLLYCLDGPAYCICLHDTAAVACRPNYCTMSVSCVLCAARDRVYRLNTEYCTDPCKIDSPVLHVVNSVCRNFIQLLQWKLLW